MRVIYDKTTFPTVHRGLGIKLIPGEFEIENEEKAKKLIELGLVRAAGPPAPTSDEPEPETNDDAISEETREVEEIDFEEQEEDG